MTAAFRAFIAITASLFLMACGAPTPTRTQPTGTPEESATPRPVASASAVPTPTVDPTLHVDGLATVLVDDLPQVVDPAHPNHNRRANSQLGLLQPGDVVFLVAQTRFHGDSYWQVVRNPDGTDGQVGWVQELTGGELTVEPFQLVCPDAFPLTADDIVDIDGLEAVACFGDTELTLSGNVTCNLVAGDPSVGGAAYMDSGRFCTLDDKLPINGRAATSLLDVPEASLGVSGRYLVRGHFDDPEAQACFAIAFGASPAPQPSRPPEPGPVAQCRAMFVAGSLTGLD